MTGRTFIRILLVASSTAVALIAFAGPAHAWDCSLPENNGVAECPYVPPTTTTMQASTTTTTAQPTTTTLPAPETTTTAAPTTSTTYIDIGTPASLVAPPTSIAVAGKQAATPTTVATGPTLPRTGSATVPLGFVALVICGIGALLARARRQGRV